MLTIIRIFGLKISEIERLSTEEAKEVKIVYGEEKNPQGAVLDVRPEEFKEKDGNY